MVQKHSKIIFWLKLTAVLIAAGLVFFCISISLIFPVRYLNIVKKQAQHFGVEPSLIYAVIWTESKFDPNAVSGAGARGLMQLLPSTAEFCAKMLGEPYAESKLFEPEYNIKLGTFYLRYLTDKFENDGFKAAIAAYNAGEGNVQKWLQGNKGIEFNETKDYVSRVSLAKRVYKVLL